MHYRVSSPTDVYAGQILRNVQNWLDQDREMQCDRERLVSVCCKPELPESLADAPRPVGLEYIPSTCGGAANHNHQEFAFPQANQLLS
jgi:hypothetical protein